MKRMASMAALVGGLVAWAVRGAEASEPGSADAWLRQAYAEVVSAEMASHADHRAEAIQAYRQALDLFARVRADYPGWQADAIDYRMADCRNQMALLAGTAANASGDTNAEARLTRLLGEVRAAGASLESAPAVEAKSSDRERMRLADERDEAVRSAQALQRRVQRLEDDLRRATKGGVAPVASTNMPLSAVPAVIKAEARRLIQAGQTEPALWLIREGERVVPDDLDLVVLHGLAACQAGRYQEAVDLLHGYDTPELKQASVLITLGSAYMGLGRIGDARVVMERALKLAPDSAEGHYNLAQILVSLKPPEAELASAHYERAVQLGSRADPDLENTLRTAIIVSRMKSHPRPKSKPADRPSQTPILPSPTASR